MPINSVITNSVNLTADKIMYSVFSAKTKSTITVQRCSVVNNEWVIDPNEGSKKTFIAPESFKTITDRLFTLLDSIYSLTFTKLVIKSTLVNKALVVSVIGVSGNRYETIDNLEVWLGSNLGRISEVSALWNDMNLAVESINTQEQYV